MRNPGLESLSNSVSGVVLRRAENPAWSREVRLTDLFFLPDLRGIGASLPWHALLLLAAALAGEAVQRWLRLPRLLGWSAVGALLGPYAFGVLDRAALDAMAPLLDIAAGVVLFELGQRVDPSWLRRNPWLLGTSILESAFGFAAMFAVLLAVGATPLVAAVAAAIGISTAPAVTLTIARDLRAQGQVSERALLLTALNSVYAFVAVGVLLSLDREGTRARLARRGIASALPRVRLACGGRHLRRRHACAAAHPGPPA